MNYAEEQILDIAMKCNETVKLWYIAYGNEWKDWDELSDKEKNNIIGGVKYLLENQGLPKSVLHDNWVESKIKDGWKVGLLRDTDNKIHEYLVPYEQLPSFPKMKIGLFYDVVKAQIEIIEQQKMHTELSEQNGSISNKS